MLGQAQNGEMVAVALWPDAATRKTAFATMDDSVAWPPCTRLEPILVDTLSDQWALDDWRMISNGE
ncbi:hypothetical protein GRI91_03985 [Altererythrobacter endophyticus]|uniref:Uncharacterized protein n=1 Tax=Altericroceibacterium endophyticum TaxID=1808508 RepID=A0A6I4T4S0_9SPHN|nr:hypothetical protein [Altericroceibacterium endophyticum]